MTENTDPTLIVNGTAYSGWKSATITQKLETIAGGFELTVSGNDPGRLPISIGDACAITLGSGDDAPEVIKGSIDKVGASLESGEFSISGRDRAGVLVDSSAAAGIPLGPFEYKEQAMLALARNLCAPFGVIVTKQEGVSLPVVPKFSIDPGETVFESITKLCKPAGVLPISDGSGGIILTRAGSRRCVTALHVAQGHPLIRPGNVLAGSASFDASRRFRRYVVLAQQHGRDEVNGATAAAVRGEAVDSGSKGDRVLILRPQGVHSAAQAKTRAEWEATVRAAQSLSLSLTVQGWTQADGTPWPLNSLVQVFAPQLGLGTKTVEMLITSVTFSLDINTGTTTALELTWPDAFKPEPVIQPKAAQKAADWFPKGV